MERREALSLVSVLFGGTVVGSGAFLEGCQPARHQPLSGLLNIDDKILIDEIGETILPQTEKSPGARELKIGSFINTIVSDCYSQAEQAVFMDGLHELSELCRSRFGKKFQGLDTPARHEALDILEEESRRSVNQNGMPHYYLMFKQLIIWAYLTSKKVSVEILGYVPVPGRYEGCLPYREGDKAIF
jgi:hypothetical protein